MYPCSVPTRNLRGPAAMSYPSEVPPWMPATVSALAEVSTVYASVGSDILRVSHQSTCPSVEVDMHSWCLDWIHWMAYTGSRCDFSMVVCLEGAELARRSQNTSSPLYDPPIRMFGSLLL